MKLLIINPNTCAGMTADILTTARAALSSGVQADVVQPDFGPESLESFYDYTLAAFGVFRLLEKSQRYDGILIACYGDPGLYALKERYSCPVLGIAEASLSLSLLMGYKFGILTASAKAVPMMENMVAQYGLRDRLAGVWPLNMPVLDIESCKDKATAHLLKVGKKALKAGADLLILGCAGMTGMAESAEEELGVPVLDPVACGCKMLEMMVKAGYTTSKLGLYATPASKCVDRKDLLA